MTGRYGVVAVDALERIAGNPAAIAVYVALATWANRDGECYPLRPTIAEAVGMSVSTVGRALRALRAAGVIETRARLQGGAKVGTVYKLGSTGKVTGDPSGKVTGDPSSRAREPLLRREQLEMNNNPPDSPALASVTDLHPGRLLDVPTTIDAVFNAWRIATRRTSGRVQLTPQRRRIIQTRLKEGYEVDDLVDAVRGIMRSPFHCGGNDRGTVYTDIRHALGDGEKVEHFRDLERGLQRGTVSKVADPAIEAIERIRHLEGR